MDIIAVMYVLYMYPEPAYNKKAAHNNYSVILNTG